MQAARGVGWQRRGERIVLVLDELGDAAVARLQRQLDSAQYDVVLILAGTNDLADRIARLANEPPRTGRQEDAEGGAYDARDTTWPPSPLELVPERRSSSSSANA